MSAKIDYVNILYELIGSDHLPLEFHVNITYDGKLDDNVNFCNNDATYYLDWKSIRPAELNNMNKRINCKMKPLFDSLSCQNCTTIGCHDKKHLEEISHCYLELVKIFGCTLDKFKRKTVRKNKFKVIPGWNRNVKHLHSVARQCYLDWVAQGRPLSCQVHDCMLTSRRNFKAALKNCKVNENQEICRSIMEKFKMKNMREFWSEVQKQKSKVKASNIIEGESENEKIVQVFVNKFFSDQAPGDENEGEFMDLFKRKWIQGKKMHIKLSVVSLKKLISNLNSGSGHDEIHSLFLKNADEEFLSRIVSFYNMCFMHCFIPLDLLKGTVNPTIKDAKANNTNVSNYRRVMQSSCLLKIIEYHMLSIFLEKVNFNHRHLGYRKGVSTTDACFLLKEVIHENSKHREKGIVTFVDMSKAFDTVDHFILGKKLLEENIPIDLIYMLMHYLRNQSANVVWNDASSKYYNLEFGVRQGGILSPFLFNFYINSIVKDVSSMDEGCSLGIFKLNILAYADDLVLIAKNVNDMNALYSKLKSALQQHKLILNRSKSKCLFFGSALRNSPESVDLDGDCLEVVDNYKYLGHLINGNLSDEEDVADKLRKFYSSTKFSE